MTRQEAVATVRKTLFQNLDLDYQSEKFVETLEALGLLKIDDEPEKETQ